MASPAELAALTEPFAVGVHAVAKSRIASGESAIVLGCGPVGLACIAELRRSASARSSPPTSPRPSRTGRADGRRRRRRSRVETPAIEAWRDVANGKPLVIFEAVGVPGMIDQAMRMAPKDARILVVGVCMQADQIHPLLGIGRELNIQFVLAYDPLEFAGALDRDRRRQRRPVAVDHRARSTSTASRRPSPTSPTPSATPRSW